MMTDFRFYCPTCDRTCEDGCGDGHGRCTICGSELVPLTPNVPEPQTVESGISKHFAEMARSEAFKCAEENMSTGGVGGGDGSAAAGQSLSKSQLT